MLIRWRSGIIIYCAARYKKPGRDWSRPAKYWLGYSAIILSSRIDDADSLIAALALVVNYHIANGRILSTQFFSIPTTASFSITFDAADDQCKCEVRLMQREKRGKSELVNGRVVRLYFPLGKSLKDLISLCTHGAFTPPPRSPDRGSRSQALRVCENTIPFCYRSRESGNPGLIYGTWIPAFPETGSFGCGMTWLQTFHSL